MTDPIRIWRFHEAPEEWQRLSTNGGDEDWLAHIPAHLRNDIPGFLTRNAVGYSAGEFGICSTDQHILDDASVVLIGAHA